MLFFNSVVELLHLRVGECNRSFSEVIVSYVAFTTFIEGGDLRMFPWQQLEPYSLKLDVPESPVHKESTSNAGDSSSIPGWERSAGEGIATYSSILGLLWWPRL